MRRRERAWESGGVDVGVDSFVAVVTDPDTGAVVESAERMAHLLEEIELADRVGLAPTASASTTGSSTTTRRRR